MKFKVLIYTLFLLVTGICNAADDIKEPHCLPKETFGKPVAFITDIFGRIVTFRWEDGKDAYCTAYREHVGKSFIIEFIPRGQTLKNWTEMLSLIGHQDIVISNQDFLKYIKRDGSFCKINNVKIINDTSKALEVVAVCGAYSSRELTQGKTVSEITHYLARRTNDNTYFFIHSKRGKAFDASTYNFDNEDIKNWSQFLNSIQLLKPSK